MSIVLRGCGQNGGQLRILWVEIWIGPCNIRNWDKPDAAIWVDDNLNIPLLLVLLLSNSLCALLVAIESVVVWVMPLFPLSARLFFVIK